MHQTCPRRTASQYQALLDSMSESDAVIISDTSTTNTTRDAQSTPWIVYVLIAVNVFLFSVHTWNAARDTIRGSTESPPGGRWLSGATLDAMKLVPDQLMSNPQREWPKVFTAMFSHANLAHLAFNMYALWRFGRPVERALGGWKTLIIYLVSGAATNVLYSMLNGTSSGSRSANGHIGLVGASGAISAIMAAYFLEFADRRNMTSWLLFQVGGMLLAEGSGVSYLSHLLGFGAGFLVYLMVQGQDGRNSLNGLIRGERRT